MPRTDGAPPVAATVRGARASASLGPMNVTLTLDLENSAGSTGVSLLVDGNLAFKGFGERVRDDGRRERTIDFAVSLLRVEPRMGLGFTNFRGRGVLADAIAAGLMRALDGNLVVNVPVDDRLALQLGHDRTEVIPTQAGSVTAAFALPRSVVERRIDLATPLALESGACFLGDLAGGSETRGEVPCTMPPSAELQARLAELRASVSQRTRSFEQSRDFVLWLKGTALTGIVVSTPVEFQASVAEQKQATGS